MCVKNFFLSNFKNEVIENKNVSEVAHSRNKIDRFTGGTLKATLFTTKPVYQKNDAPILHVHFEIRNAKEFEAGLAIFLLRDLWLGKVAVGSEKCIGRGTLKGISAKINYNGEIELEIEALTPLFFGGNGEKVFHLQVNL